MVLVIVLTLLVLVQADQLLCWQQQLNDYNFDYNLHLIHCTLFPLCKQFWSVLSSFCCHIWQRDGKVTELMKKLEELYIQTRQWWVQFTAGQLVHTHMHMYCCHRLCNLLPDRRQWYAMAGSDGTTYHRLSDIPTYRLKALGSEMCMSLCLCWVDCKIPSVSSPSLDVQNFVKL